MNPRSNRSTRRFEPIRLGAIVACLSAFPTMHATADVRDTPTERVLSLPDDSPSLVVARGDWVIAREQRRAGDTAVYYMLTSKSQELILSVYIDRSAVCRSAEACLGIALQNESYVDPKELTTFESGNFKAARFYLDQPKGATLAQAHVLAAAYVEGCWFDVHISKSGGGRPDMAPLLDLLKNLKLR